MEIRWRTCPQDTRLQVSHLWSNSSGDLPFSSRFKIKKTNRRPRSPIYIFQLGARIYLRARSTNAFPCKQYKSIMLQQIIYCSNAPSFHDKMLSTFLPPRSDTGRMHERLVLRSARLVLNPGVKAESPLMGFMNTQFSYSSRRSEPWSLSRIDLIITRRIFRQLIILLENFVIMYFSDDLLYSISRLKIHFRNSFRKLRNFIRAIHHQPLKRMIDHDFFSRYGHVGLIRFLSVQEVWKCKYSPSASFHANHTESALESSFCECHSMNDRLSFTFVTKPRIFVSENRKLDPFDFLLYSWFMSARPHGP